MLGRRGGGKKVQFSDKQLQIFDRENMAAISILPLNFIPNGGFWHQFALLKKNLTG